MLLNLYTTLKHQKTYNIQKTNMLVEFFEDRQVPWKQCYPAYSRWKMSTKVDEGENRNGNE